MELADILGDNFLLYCVIPETPTKQEDNLGQATPDLVIIRHGRQGDGAEEGEMDSYEPLCYSNLEEKLQNE